MLTCSSVLSVLNSRGVMARRHPRPARFSGPFKRLKGAVKLPFVGGESRGLRPGDPGLTGLAIA